MNLFRAAPAEPPRLLIAGGDDVFDAALLAALARTGMASRRVRHVQDLAVALRGAGWDVVLLGGLATAVDGLAAVLGTQPPPLVVVLLASAGAAERIGWLDRGADDVVALPAEPEEVAARIRAALRRTQRAREATVLLQHGPLCLHTEQRTATWHGREVAVTQREFRLLEALLRRRHGVVSRAALEDLLYGWTEETNSNAVEVHVHHLRRKFDRRLIVTLRGSGYRLGAADALAG